MVDFAKVGIALFVVGFLLALMNFPSYQVLPLGGEYYLQVGDVLALVGGGMVAYAGHKAGNRMELFGGVALIVLDFVRVFAIGSPFSP